MDKLSNMSYKELNDLEKLIRAEKEKRNTLVYKGDLGVLQKLHGTDKNAIKLVFKSDDKYFKSGKFSMDGKTYKLELEKK